jgi:halocyanin-like protein
MNRRRFLALSGLVGVTAAAGCFHDTEEAPEAPEYGEWFGNTDNFDGFVDRTDRDTVAVLVGAGEQGLLFDPPAITATPGTTVRWEWTGKGGAHNVQQPDEDWKNPEGTVSEEGHTWDRTFDSPGTHRYECWPHTGLGMRGAVFVNVHAEG